MNTVEHIVESYYRLCKGCFTISDVKVWKGNNRQIDLLAVNFKSGEQFHVECSVTHCENWCPTANQLAECFEQKFSGVPKKRAGANTDSAKGKRYGGVIGVTYELFGLELTKIQLIWVCWVVKDPDNLNKMLYNYFVKTGQKITVLSFRDTILPELLNKIGTSNYDDEVLRTFSLMKQRDEQTKRGKK